jgi:hypothetical protein
MGLLQARLRWTPAASPSRPSRSRARCGTVAGHHAFHHKGPHHAGSAHVAHVATDIVILSFRRLSDIVILEIYISLAPAPAPEMRCSHYSAGITGGAGRCPREAVPGKRTCQHHLDLTRGERVRRVADGLCGRCGHEREPWRAYDCEDCAAKRRGAEVVPWPAPLWGWGTDPHTWPGPQHEDARALVGAHAHLTCAPPVPLPSRPQPRWWAEARAAALVGSQRPSPPRLSW